MSRASRRRHPRRVHCWKGVVDDICGGLLWCYLTPADHEGPELFVTFDHEHLPDARLGELFNLYVWRRGKKVRTVLRRRDLGVWTEEALAKIEALAKARSQPVRELAE